MSQNSETKRPVKRSEVSKLQWTWQEMKNNKTAYFMLAPFLLLFIIFTVLPCPSQLRNFRTFYRTISFCYL